MKKHRITCVLTALLMLAGCGKTDKKQSSGSAPDAVTATQTAADSSSAAETTEEAVTPTASSMADSSSKADDSLYVVETHGAREYDGAAASDDFSDALFIGDSRTVGLMLNGDKPKADFFATPGLNVMTAQTTPVVPKSDFIPAPQAMPKFAWDNGWDDTWTDDYNTWDDGGWTDDTWDDTTGWDDTETESSEEDSSEEEDDDLMTIPDALAFKRYNRVFLNFGVNELGWPSPEVFVERYKLLVLQIRSAQPTATIYVESMLPVSYLAYSIDTCYTTANVDNFNENYIRRVAEETNCTYLDVNQFFRDSRGDLFYEASTDGIHLTRDYCLEWMDILAYYTGGGGDLSVLTKRNETSSTSDGGTSDTSLPDTLIPESLPDVVIPDTSTDAASYEDSSEDDGGYGYGDYNDSTDYGYDDYNYDYNYDYDYYY